MAGRKLKLLIADDDKSVQQSFRLILSGRCEMYIADDGEEALKMARDKKPDLVFLDIKMPKANGLQALKDIKAIDPKIPVIIVTGYNSVEIAVEAIKLGARDYILKPFSKEQILKAVEKIAS